MKIFKHAALGMTVAATLALLAAGCEPSVGTVSQASVYYPEPTGYVVDSTNTLTEATRRAVEADLKGFDEKAQVAVVVVDTIQPLTVEEYGINLAEKWKPGYKGKDNGVILIIVKGDRKVRIEVGRGLEGSINDGKAGKILDDCVVPSLKNNNYDDAVTQGIGCIKKEIN